ncbi:MAG: VCBS repeat-containing protein [Akkermansiaceae bacterium]|nr:VCBS repeat-containing protein [Akkermansiaceae bacterium]
MRLTRHLLFLFSALSTTAIAEPIVVDDELVKLRLKEMARPDRLPVPVESKTPLTGVPLNFNLPVAEASDSWLGEKFSILALSQLNRLAKAQNEEEATSLLAPGFLCSEFETPGPIHTVHSVAVRVGTGGKVRSISPKILIEEIHALGELKLKVIGVENLTTRVHVEANRGDGEYSATWLCSWTDESPPKLQRLEVANFEKIRAEGSWFQDVTKAALEKNPRFEAQVLRGIGSWSQRITRIGDLAMTGHHGIAVGDVNGDGLEDIYVCDGGSLPNQLYLQQADGTAKEVASKWGVAWLEDSRSALLVDLDNDGDQDLVVATIAMIAFAENNGTGKFELRGGFPGAPYPFSLSAADFDSDGDLDIYTCVYSADDDSVSGKRGFEASSPTPFNDAENGGRNVLLANLSDFKFGDVTKQVGMDQNNTRWSFAASWEDFDRDGDPDLYVANDFGRNCLYRNDDGKFVNSAPEVGAEDMAAGMSVSWGDFNRDGEADLFVGNMFSSAGQRVAFQRKFSDGKTRMARGNTLFSANDGVFQDHSLESGVTNGGWAWSSGFADLNNDGWQDLVVANGYLTNTRDDDL